MPEYPIRRKAIIVLREVIFSLAKSNKAIGIEKTVVETEIKAKKSDLKMKIWKINTAIRAYAPKMRSFWTYFSKFIWSRTCDFTFTSISENCYEIIYETIS